MREWHRTPAQTVCGGCGASLPPGSPVLEIAIGDGYGRTHTGKAVKRRLKRCQQCVGEAPPDLPLRIEQKAMTPQRKPVKVGAVAFDWKSKQAGD